MTVAALANIDLAVPALETEGFARLPGSLAPGILLLADHAANAVPPEYERLGLPEAAFAQHIAYDIGIAGVVRLMSELLDAPALLTRHSRLVIDCNRGLDDPTLVMRISDGQVIPGNCHLSAAALEERIARYYRPYHAAIGELREQALAAGITPVIVSMHSFTPNWRGGLRPWHVGVLWDKDPRLSDALLAKLGEDRPLVVGDNEPYTGCLKGDTLWQHATAYGLAHVLIEIRQDLIASAAGQMEWAARLSSILTSILDGNEASPQMREIVHYGSNAR